MLALELKKQMRIRNKFFVLQEVRPQWEKEARIKSILQSRYSSGSIIHSKDTENIWELEHELLKFPNWKHDDLADSLAGAVSLLEINDIATNDYEPTSFKSMGELDGLL
jgi:phage terminase large subunit-like protein